MIKDEIKVDSNPVDECKITNPNNCAIHLLCLVVFHFFCSSFCAHKFHENSLKNETLLLNLPHGLSSALRGVGVVGGVLL